MRKDYITAVAQLIADGPDPWSKPSIERTNREGWTFDVSHHPADLGARPPATSWIRVSDVVLSAAELAAAIKQAEMLGAIIVATEADVDAIWQDIAAQQGS